MTTNCNLVHSCVREDRWQNWFRHWKSLEIVCQKCWSRSSWKKPWMWVSFLITSFLVSLSFIASRHKFNLDVNNWNLLKKIGETWHLSRILAMIRLFFLYTFLGSLLPSQQPLYASRCKYLWSIPMQFDWFHSMFNRSKVPTYFWQRRATLSWLTSESHLIWLKLLENETLPSEHPTGWHRSVITMWTN